MHHQDFPGDAPGTGSRKTVYHYRRGSGGASAASAAADDTPTQAGSSSPGLHHQHQPQAAGAQVKKKSGFQITSVTSAQVNVSGNNSLADDTESYDDMDESHTEDLSSSDMLDVSVPKAADTGVPERSSSDETLNSLHGVDTPGLVSPNEPLHHHSVPQGSMVNGTLHHHYYPQQHSHHHSDPVGGGEPAVPALPIAPLANSSTVVVSQAGSSHPPRQPMLDKPSGGTNQPLGTVDPHPQGNVSGSGAAAPAGFDSTTVSAQVASAGGGASAAAAPPNTQTHHGQSQAATGSRFRVVKLNTYFEPIRRGRWTCIDYYDKEVYHPTAVEPARGAEVAAESEPGNAGAPAVQPQQGLAQATPLNYVVPQEVSGGVQVQKPGAPVAFPAAAPQAAVAQLPQQVPYAVDPHQAQPQGSYPAAPQLHAGARQPDFIQPTAPFQTQVQPPAPHVTPGIPITPVPGVQSQQPVSIAQQLPHQAQGAPPTQAVFAGQPQTLPAQPQPLQQPQVQAPSSTTVPGAPAHGTPSMPLTAVLQPLLTPGATFAQAPGGGSSSKASQLEDAQKLLLQHQGLLGLPRLGGAAEVGGAAGTLAHMGMSAEASVFMAAAAAAGLRTQHGEGDEDSSSGASVVAIDNKIEQAMDLVKSHLMYAVREEVEVLKEQIKELIERNTQLEQENNLLKNLASPEQMAQFQAQVQTGGSPSGGGTAQPAAPAPPGTSPGAQNSGASA